MKVRVADWIAEYLHNIGVTKIHGLMGGGAAGLNDGFIKNGKLDYICYHHEQGAGHAAIGESKYTGKLAVVNPTTGCAGTNCATSVLNAWQDGVPILFISGNVRLNTCAGWINQTKGTHIRHYGIQEHHIVDTYKSMTKFSEFVTKPENVPFILQKAIHLATTGRKGPVWIDIPSDVQTAEMPAHMSFIPDNKDAAFLFPEAIKDIIHKARRPIVLAGQGIRQAGCVDSFVKFIEKYKLPYVSTYGATDYTEYEHNLHIGAVGIKGTRAANFAMQNADTLIILGSSLGAPVVGYDPSQFSPKSYKVYVDIDLNELRKDIVKIDYNLNTSLEKFFEEMLKVEV